ncbi:MAG: alpha/beta hydrolase [Bryobacteraceae bacterium]
MIGLVAAAAGLALAAEAGIVYGEAGGETLTLDYYAGAGAASRPAVILIHGGGFTGGDSRGAAYYAEFLAPAGYAVFAINYRLAPKHPYPAAVQDVRRAVRFVRKNAKRWRVDGRRIALMGGAEGGYLGSLAGVAPEKGSDVQAVVSLGAPSDFRGQPVTAGLLAFLGMRMEEVGAETALAEASPAMHIGPDAPPFLFVHGDRDEGAPLAQSVHFQLALQEAGVAADLIVIAGGGGAPERWREAGSRDWEGEVVAWLGSRLGVRGAGRR